MKKTLIDPVNLFVRVLQEDFIKARTPGAKDVRPRKRKGAGDYDLHAERSEIGQKRHMGSFASHDEAKSHVNKLEEQGKWPEGHEAMLTHKKTGKRWNYTDTWEAQN